VESKETNLIKTESRMAVTRGKARGLGEKQKAKEKRKDILI